MSWKRAKVLLLNASYEALGVRNGREAFSLLRRRDAHGRPVAEVVEAGDGRSILRSSRAGEPVPSVVRLVTYRDVRRWQALADAKGMRIFRRDNWRCGYCGRRFAADKLTKDHVLPKSRGGPDEAWNLVTACRPCNNRKADRTPDEAGMPLLFHPGTLHCYPHGLVREAIRLAESSRPEWRRYLFLGEAREGAA